LREEEIIRIGPEQWRQRQRDEQIEQVFRSHNFGGVGDFFWAPDEFIVGLGTGVVAARAGAFDAGAAAGAVCFFWKLALSKTSPESL